MKLKCSPYYILIFTQKFSLFLLTLPLQTLFVINSPSHTGLFFLVANILISATIIICALISLHNIRLVATTSRFIFKKGIFSKQTLIIPKRKYHSICASQTPFQRIMRVCKVTLVSGSAKGEIFLSVRNLKHIPCTLTFSKRKRDLIFKSSITDILIMCAGFSPALSAALTLAPLIRSISKLTSAQLITSANLWETLGYYRLPPLIGTISSLILIEWFIGFVLAILRFWKLSLRGNLKGLQKESGFLSKRLTTFLPKSVRGVVFKQSVLMFLFCRQRVDFILSNEQKIPHITAGCVPNHTHPSLFLNPLGIYLSPVTRKKIKPNPNSLISYTLLPLLSLCALSVFSIFISTFSPYKIEPHLGVFICLWCCIWFLHRVLAFYHSSITISKDVVCIRTFSGLSFIKVFVLTKNIRCTQITQNIFQMRKSTCNLRIYIKCNRKKSFLLRHISIKKAAELSNKFCG